MLQKTFYPALERFYECLECHEAISNPLCPSCLAVQIEAWLTSYPELGKKLMPQIEGYIEKTKNLTGKTISCVSCTRKRASLCPYCFTHHVFDLLKDMKVNKRILIEFLQFFNFDFYHTGYSKDAEELGVIWKNKTK